MFNSVHLCLTSVSFRQAIIDTVNLGGDADTTGAMVGAIAGALYGKSAIPAEWYERLHARDRFDDRIEALVDRPADWVPETPLVVLETEWDSLFDRQ